MLTSLGIIAGTGIVGFFCWESSQYRAATPLVFIFGLALLFTIFFRQIKELLNGRLFRFSSAARSKRIDEQRLWRWRIPQLVVSLYFSHIQQYPEWIRESRDYVPSSVTNAGRTEAGQIMILLYYAQYAFTFTSFPIVDNEQPQGMLEVVREGRRELLLRVLQTSTKKGLLYWVPTAIEAFEIREDWIRELRNLQAEILAIIKDRAREARES